MAARRKLRGGVEDEATERHPPPRPRRPSPSTPAAPLEARHRPSPNPSRCGWPTAAGSTATACRPPRRWSSGGPIDVLTGDWLAELTMLILAKGKLKDPDLGFATTFLTQMEQVLGTCLAEGIVVVSNAGGLNPAGCAEALAALAARLGLSPKVAYVRGRRSAGSPGRAGRRGHRPAQPRHRRVAGRARRVAAHGQRLPGRRGASAEALDHDADVVITGRVTDAAAGGRAGRLALRLGPHRLGPPGRRRGGRPRPRVRRPVHRRQLRLLHRGPRPGAPRLPLGRDPPGRLVRGHQAPRHRRAGVGRHRHRPAALRDPGTSATTTPTWWWPSTPSGSPTTVPTGSACRAWSAGRPRPPPRWPSTTSGGYRNSMTFVLTGLDIEAKAELAERTLWSLIPGGQRRLRGHRRDPAPHRPPRSGHQRRTPSPSSPSRSWTATRPRSAGPSPTPSSRWCWPATPACSPPGPRPSHQLRRLLAEPRARRRAAPRGGDGRASASLIEPVVVPDGRRPRPTSATDADRYRLTPPSTAGAASPPQDEPTTRIALGRVVGARSGDKGGNANIGVWARHDDAYEWLAAYLTEDRLRQLLPAETEGLACAATSCPTCGPSTS